MQTSNRKNTMRETVYIITGANGGLGFQTVKQLLHEHKSK